MNTNTREKIIKDIKITLQGITIIALCCMMIGVAKKQEPIQELLNQIESNEAKIQQYQERTTELFELNEQHKQKLLNEYGLELSKAFTKNVSSEHCIQAVKTSQRLINDGVQTVEEAKGILIEQGCESYQNQLQDDWKPGKLSEDGTHQEMPVLTGSDSHSRFKELATAYGLDPSQIRAVEQHYGIKEGVILCITVAETSGGNRGYAGKNIGSVGSNDRGDRPTYALMESGLEAIGKTLTNQYLGGKKTLGCLSNAGSCVDSNDNGKRYATSESSREKNMVACLSDIYGPINASDFNIRR